MSSVRCWISCWLMLCLAGTKVCTSQNSYWVPSYYNNYPIESNVPQSRYFREANPSDYSLGRNNLNFAPYPSNYDYQMPSQDIQDERHGVEERSWDEQDILDKMEALERILSDDPNEGDLKTRNSINYKIISDSLMPEETRRVVRQVKKDKPGFFWTLARLAFETFNDTKSAVNQISTIVGNSFDPDPTTKKPLTNDSLMDSSKMSTMTVQNKNTTTQSTTEASMTTSSTTAIPKLTISQLQTLIRRNVKGLVRLFNIEWQEALKQSDMNVDEFRKDLGKQVGMYLQDNPNAY